MESLESKDWELVHRSLDAQGYAVIKQVLTETECGELIDLYQKELLFRSTINMERFRFGQGVQISFTTADRSAEGRIL